MLNPANSIIGITYSIARLNCVKSSANSARGVNRYTKNKKQSVREIETVSVLIYVTIFATRFPFMPSCTKLGSQKMWGGD